MKCRLCVVCLLAVLSVILCPVPSFAEWDDPDPEVQLRAGLGIEGFVRLARLAPSAEVEAWMTTVLKAFAGEEPVSASPAVALAAIVSAMAEYGFRYRGAAALQSWQRRDISKNVPPADELLVARRGECRQTSLLVAATLQKLGWEVVLVVTRVHVVPALVTAAPCPPGEQAVEVAPWGGDEAGRRCLWPLESTFLDRDAYDIGQARARGTRFVQDAVQLHGSLIANLDGDVLWHSPVPPLFMAGRTARAADAGKGE